MKLPKIWKQKTTDALEHIGLGDLFFKNLRPPVAFFKKLKRRLSPLSQYLSFHSKKAVESAFKSSFL